MKNKKLKNKNKHLIKSSVLGTLGKNIPLSALLFAAVCSSAAAALVPPQLLRLIIDRCLIPKNAEGLLSLAVIYITVIAFAGIFDFLKGAVLTVFGQKISAEIRKGMIAKLEKIRCAFFTQNTPGAVVSRITNDVDTVSTLFTGGIVVMAADCLKIAGIVFSVFFFSRILGLISLLLLPLLFFITRSFQKRMLAAQIQNRIITGKISSHIAESLKNVLMIKSFGKERMSENKYAGYLKESFGWSEKANFYDSSFSPVILLLRAAVIGVIVILASGRIGTGITVGMAAASVELISDLFAPVENLGTELQNIQSAVSGMRRVNEFAGEPEDEPKKALKARDIIPDGKTAGLLFGGVSFCYDGGTDILRDICLVIRPLDRVTFTGRTGVGKTTLFNLITGLIRPAEGAITVNGTDVYDIPNSEKRKIFGYADQTFHFIRGSVADQISLRDRSITREDVLRALDFVGMTGAVSALPEGPDTEVSGDNLFSQGQKQLLAIARAVAADPPILLFDEITAGLDSVTEERIMGVLKKAGGSRTVLSISHRLSSVMPGDTVVIMENGRVVRAGSAEAMLSQDEWYRSRIALEKLSRM